ncbi:FAH family protein [Streptomyces sp. H27-D2]|uniref:FAH family protein n=1 Tax=Streptomyces sp. H27-D2 TaxID=3046304 RepID=UPI002DB9D3C4|nr:FAH family protein [Streptomyces sp. H27-D2]MEC4015051.1 FAH family protein [Streptomyces sp. H27-D2]
MTVFFECVHRGRRHFGLGKPGDGEPLVLYPLGDDDPLPLVVAAGGDGAALAAALTAGREAVTVPAAERDTVSFRPPLLPRSAGDAMVGGFMQTHNVKVDASTQSQPNWFLKGLGDVLKVSGEDLAVPSSAVALCEEAEVVLVYVTDEQGRPRYAGYTFGNDLTDIGRFKRHAGHLSYAKLCDAAVAPWLFLDAPPQLVEGRVTIERDGRPAWEGDFTTGAKALHYGLDAMVSELFSYEALCHPGRVHYVFIGADRSSFHAGFRMTGGDRVTIEFTSHDVTLSNVVRWPAQATAAPAEG